MATIAEKQAARDAVLIAVYELSEGKPLDFIELERVVERTGLAPEIVSEADAWLADRELLKHRVFGPVTNITPNGIDEAERILADRERAALNLGVLSVVTPEQGALLERLTSEVLAALENGTLVLAVDDEAEARVQVDTIATQMRSPRPRAGVIGAALKALAWVGGAVLAGILGNAVYDLLQPLMHLG